MKKDKQEVLLKKYKKIFKQYKWPPTKTAMCWGLEVGDGWYDLMDRLCDDIQRYVDVENVPQIEATQVKQKFGSLRFYYRPFDIIVERLIHQATEESIETCEFCGSKDDVKMTKKGWITPICKKCILEEEK